MRHTTTIAATALLIVTAISVLGFAQPATTQTDQAQPTPDDTNAPSPDLGPHEAILRLRDGRFISGILIEETPTTIVLEIAGVRTSFDLRRVDRLEILPPLDVRYETWRESVNPADTPEMLLIAEWLLARGRYDDAIAEVETALENNPSSAEARRLRTLITQQRRLAVDEPTPTNINNPRSREARARVPLLSDEDLNTMRLLEVDLRDPPRFSIPDDLPARVRALAPESAAVARMGRDPEPIDTVRAIFELRARDLYPEIQIEEDPPHLRRYLTQVHNRWILNSCATSRCHGGAEAGRLALAPRDTDRDRVGYTNLLIMARHNLESGEALINFDEPARSPLLTMALPLRDSSNPHPPVSGFRSALPSESHPRYQAALRWIEDMHRPRPEYPIETPLRTLPPPEITPQPDPISDKESSQPDQLQNENPASDATEPE